MILSWQCRNATILQMKAKLHPNNFHEDALMHILFFPLNKWHALCCLQFPSSPQEGLEDVISQRVLLGRSAHKWSLNLICHQTCWDGGFAANDSSVGEESPSRSHPSCEQFMGRVWGYSPATPPGLSHEIFIAEIANNFHCFHLALMCPKASWLQRTAQIFGNCHCPVINCHACHFWIYLARLIHLWFTPLCLWSLLMISFAR